jgi:hypothetical protein
VGHGSGRPISWIAVLVICLGFVIGGVGLCQGPPIWWIFWTGLGIAIAGSVFAWAVGIMEDYTTGNH